ncbi:hypothetical protein Tco_1520101, partial [Tanacetum coccineum]
PGADKTASPLGDDRHGEAFLTATSLDAGQDRENIVKTSAMPHEASPRVTSLGGGEGSMQQQLTKLMDICTSLQRQHSLMEAKIQSQDLEITQLKTKIKTLEDNEKMREGFAQEDAPNMGGGSMGGFVEVQSQFLPLLVQVFPLLLPLLVEVFPLLLFFTTASVATPKLTRSLKGIVIEPSSPISVNIPSISKKDKGKGIMTEPEKPSKEKELDMMIAELDRSNEVVAKHLSEYEQAEAELSHNEKKMMEIVPAEEVYIEALQLQEEWKGKEARERWEQVMEECWFGLQDSKRGY